jgi:hypothetical protein
LVGIPGQGFYLGERKLATSTCRDEVADALDGLVAGGAGPIFTVDLMHSAMVVAWDCLVVVCRLAARPCLWGGT